MSDLRRCRLFYCWRIYDHALRVAMQDIGAIYGDQLCDKHLQKFWDNAARYAEKMACEYARQQASA